jgi:hypothetical protein
MSASNTVELCALACRLAARQHGLVTRKQLRQHGITDRQTDYWLATDFLSRVERGVFMVAGAQLTWAARLLSVCLLTGGIASHRSAAVLHGLRDATPGRPEITIPLGQSFRRSGIRVHESTDLHLMTPTTRDGIPVTPVARTVLDLGAVARPRVEDTARDAVAQRLTTWPELLSTLIRHSRHGRRGCGALREVLDDYYGDKSEGGLERRFVELIRAAGLPMPEQQVRVDDDHGLVMWADFGYRAEKIAIETDSIEFHLTDKAFELDRIKRNRLRLAGWLLLEFTSRRLRRRPTAVCEEVATALALRGHPAIVRQSATPTVDQ